MAPQVSFEIFQLLLIISLLLFVVAVLGKLAGALFVPVAWRSRGLLGLAMVPRGEVSLIFAQIGVTSGVLSNETYAAVLAMLTYIMVLSPIAINYYFHRVAKDGTKRCG